MKSQGVNTDYIEMNSTDGHDAFLSDTAQMSKILREIFATENTEKNHFFHQPGIPLCSL
jgi:hypothetical protein